MLFLKKFKFFLVITVLICAPLGGFFWWRWAVEPIASQSTAEKLFVIQKGESSSSVADRLKRENLIKNALAFKILVYLRGFSDKIQAGDFRLRPSLSAQEIAKALTHGTLDIWLTFPEGWRREEFTQRLAANLENFDNQEFLALTKDFEGYFFPDTYLIPKDASASMVLGIFQKNFEKKFTSSLETAAEKKNLTREQVLILASLVEREAKHEKDKPIVAGILIKRWRNDWPLQVDATLQYAKGSQLEWWPKVTAQDKKINSLYNTYQSKGLPPAPICNSGLDSIKAVINSQETDYWFYLSDKQGQMHYAQTSDEHNQNIVRYLK